MRLELPYPPTVNHYWKEAVFGRGPNAKRGRIRTERAKAYRTDVIAAVWANGQPEPLAGPLRLDVVYRPPDRRERNVDNLQKGLFHALEHARVYDNDVQVWDFRARWDLGNTGRIIVQPGGLAIVTIEPLETAPVLFDRNEGTEGPVNNGGGGGAGDLDLPRHGPAPSPIFAT